MKLRYSLLLLVLAGVGVVALFAQQGPPSATLSWTAPTVATPAALSYKVQRATAAAGPFTQVAAPSATTFVDTAVTRGTSYFYRIFSSCPATGAGCGTVAVPVNGDSTAFLAGNATIPNAAVEPPAPTNLTITVQ